MKNYEIVNLVRTYVAVRNAKTEEVKLPAAVAWKKRLNFDKLSHANELIAEAQKEINERYSDDEHSTEVEVAYKDEDGMTKKRTERRVMDEFVTEFEKELKTLFDQETDVDIKKVKIDDLKGVDLTDADMDTLWFMIEE